jgi:glycosyltransferase involved in cell wall biosynthesis
VERRRQGVDPALPFALAGWLGANQVDLVHTHNRMAMMYGAPAGRLARLPVVHTKHGRNPGSALQLFTARLAARCVDAFVAVSHETAAFARARREVGEGRLSVIPNGIELARFHPDPAARERIRAELGLGPGTWVVGTVGRLSPEKNQALLLRAVAPLLDDRTRLVIAGDGALRQALGELATALGASDRIRFLGARRDVPRVLCALDAFALSSDSEGLPLVIPEAMATGLPVVATSVGGVPDVLDDGRTGFLVPAGDEAALRAQLARLRADRDLGQACGARARAAALERFSAERMLRDYLDLYQRVLARRRRPG